MANRGELFGLCVVFISPRSKLYDSYEMHVNRKMKVFQMSLALFAIVVVATVAAKKTDDEEWEDYKVMLALQFKQL